MLYQTADIIINHLILLSTPQPIILALNIILLLTMAPLLIVAQLVEHTLTTP